MARTPKGNPPIRIKANKSGSVSIMSWMTYMNLPQNCEFEVAVEDGKLQLNPVGAEHPVQP